MSRIICEQCVLTTIGQIILNDRTDYEKSYVFMCITYMYVLSLTNNWIDEVLNEASCLRI